LQEREFNLAEMRFCEVNTAIKMTELRFCHADKINRVLIAVYIDSIMGVYKNSPHIHYCVYYAEAVCFGFIMGRRIGWQTAGIKNITLRGGEVGKQTSLQ